MEITLQLYMKHHGLHNMLLAKFQLLEQKKLGHLFFAKDISELGLNDSFQLYYYLLSHEKSERNAFPIPKHSFSLASDNDVRYEKLKSHFESYYLNDELDKEGFGQYDLNNPFIGEDYVWLFKRTI